jgi:hypothetical protein
MTKAQKSEKPSSADSTGLRKSEKGGKEVQRIREVNSSFRAVDKSKQAAPSWPRDTLQAAKLV